MASNFNILWQAQLGTPYSDTPVGIGIDNSDNSYVAGTTPRVFGSTNVGGGMILS